MLYRAVGADNINRIGLAISENGEHFERFEAPHLEGDELSVYERLGMTSPRLTRIDRDYLLAYASLSVYSQGKGPVLSEAVPWRSRISLIKTRDFRRFERMGAVLKDLDSYDPVLFPTKIQGNYWLMHRLDKGIHVSVAPNLHSWGGGYQFLEPVMSWETGGVGAASAPIALSRGWLLFYNARDAKGVGRVGALLLDRQNPAFVLGRTKEPILMATEPWEKGGRNATGLSLAGVIVASDNLHLYYGAGTNGIGLGKISVDAALQSLGIPAAE
jgi:predicted GH43/DUF377 family glycosyl hydrolase